MKQSQRHSFSYTLFPIHLEIDLFFSWILRCVGFFFIHFRWIDWNKVLYWIIDFDCDLSQLNQAHIILFELEQNCVQLCRVFLSVFCRLALENDTWTCSIDSEVWRVNQHFNIWMWICVCAEVFFQMPCWQFEKWFWKKSGTLNLENVSRHFTSDQYPYESMLISMCNKMVQVKLVKK